MPGPLLVGLTGGVAAGKSEALRILGDLGAATISADAIVHELLDEDHVRGLLAERWGERVAPSGLVDRGAIAGIVFTDPEELRWLEAVLHPLVGDRLSEWRAALDPDLPIAVAEIPLLFEGSTAPMFDATISVSAADHLRVERAAARGTGEVEGRDGRQLSQQEKAALATYAVDNSGSVAELGADLRRVYDDLLTRR